MSIKWSGDGLAGLQNEIEQNFKKLSGSLKLTGSEEQMVSQVIAHFKKGGVEVSRAEARKIVREAK